MEESKVIVNIDKYQVPTLVKEIEDICSLKVQVGTTGFCGGDASKGCRTVFRIEDICWTDMRGGIKGHYSGKCGVDAGGDDLEKIEIAFGGDQELVNFVDALEFAVNTLCEQTNMKRDLSQVPTEELLEELSKREEKKPDDGFNERERVFFNYITELIQSYKETKSLRGMGVIRERYGITAVTKEVFFCAGFNDVDTEWLSTDEGKEFVKYTYSQVTKKNKEIKHYTQFAYAE